MNDTDTAARTRRIIIEHLGLEPEKATDDAHLSDDLGADSLDSIELAMALEEEFGSEFRDDDVAEWTDVASVIRNAEKSVAEKAGRILESKRD